MSAKSSPALTASLPSSGELVLTRVFDAPRSLVWKAWTEPDHLAQWWGPNGYTNPICEVELRRGGAIHIEMRAPDGVVYSIAGEFQEIVEPERLVFTERVVFPSDAFHETGQVRFELLNMVTFVDQGGKTLLRLHSRVVNSTPAAAPYIEGVPDGWKQSFERLATYVVTV